MSIMVQITIKWEVVIKCTYRIPITISYKRRCYVGMTKPLWVINGEDLMDMDYKPIKFVVKDFLTQGLTVLAGAPKTGKSFFALWLCLCVAKGKPVWDYETAQGTVLYFCLEDNPERLQNRILTITDDAPANLFFCWESNSLGNGLEEQIRNFLLENEDTVLLVIDTLQCVRKQNLEYSYGTDYKEIQSLKKIADEYQLTILLIHHLRKQESKDAFHMISGTTGIQGAADTCLVMTEYKRGSGEVKLSILGRDMERRELKLERDANSIWIKVDDSLENRNSEVDEIVAIVDQCMQQYDFLSGESSTLAETLCTASGKAVSHLSLLKRLKKNSAALFQMGYLFHTRRSDGKRILEISKITGAVNENFSQN